MYGLVLIGHGSQHAETTGEFHQFAQSVALRLGIHVQPCFLEFNDPPIAEAIRQCVQMGLTQITVLPLFLSAGVHQKNDVPNIINLSRQQWPQVRFQYCTPLGVQYHTLNAMSDRLDAATTPDEQIAAEKTAVAVVGYGTRDPDANAEVARLARLLYEGRDFGWVEPAYYLLTKPDVKTIIQRFAKLGAQRVIVLPYLIFTGRVYESMIEQATQAAAAAGLKITITSYLFPHPSLLEAVAERFDEAVNGKAAMTCDLCKYRRKMPGQENEFGLAQGATHGHGLGSKNIPMHEFEQRLAQWLPPKYQKNTQVSAAAMLGAADLSFDQNGEVAWDDMWTDFCDLALAGGPSHRSELLEPVSPDLISQDPQGYDAAMREIIRGITMVTGLTAAPAAAGWVCVPCDSADMAIWLLRAIVVENVFARRENAKLLLPVGPNYTLKNEIKAIVTVVAKTHHYWREHIIALKRAGGQGGRGAELQSGKVADYSLPPATLQPATLPPPLLPQQIATESFRRISAEIAKMGLTLHPAHVPIIERVIHSTADFEFAQRLQFSTNAVDVGVAALQRGCHIVTDVNMLRIGINEKRVQALGCTLNCFVDAEQISVLATQAGITRSAMGIRLAHARGLLDNGIVVIGNAPTALFEILRLIQSGQARPALVVGVPVGFVNVIESKQALMQEQAHASAFCEWVIADGRKGGSTVAAAIMNALLRAAQNAAADEIAPT